MNRSATLLTRTALAAAALGMPLSLATAAHADDVAATGAGNQLQQAEAHVEPSIVRLQTQYSAWVRERGSKDYLNKGYAFEFTGSCTGYIVNPNGYIATAGHCVDPADAREDILQAAAEWAHKHWYTSYSVNEILAADIFSLENEDYKKGLDMTVDATWEQAGTSGPQTKTMPAAVVKFTSFEKGDAALLKVNATDLPAVQLAGAGDLEIGTPVVAIGFPASVRDVTGDDFAPSYKDGSISSVKSTTDGLSTVYETSAPVSGGMSGGPTVDLNGKVIGFNSFGIIGESQPFNFLRPSGTILAMMADAGVENVLDETSTQYQTGLDAYFAGDKKAAVAALEQVLETSPAHPLAQEYLVKAKELPEPVVVSPEPSGGIAIVQLVIGASVLALVAAVTATLLIRRRSHRAQPDGGNAAGPVASAPEPWFVPQRTQTAPPAEPVATAPTLYRPGHWPVEQ